MGYNIAGLAIANNFDKDIDKLAEALGWKLEVQGEITFEQASANWTPDGQCNVWFSDKATLVFFPHEWSIDEYSADGAKSMCYAYSATSMTFLFSYSDENWENQRFIIESEGEMQVDEGTPHPLEAETDGTDDLIFRMLDELLGSRFYDIDLADAAYKCVKH